MEALIAKSLTDVRSLKALLKTLRENGVVKLKVDGLELDLAEGAPTQSEAGAPPQPYFQDEEPEMSEEELLFYSADSPGSAAGQKAEG